MSQLQYQMLDFWEEPERIRINLSKRFYLYVDKNELSAIAPFKIYKNALAFDCPQDRAERKFLQLLNTKIQSLKSIVTNNKAVYIHKNAGIPLIGSISFGIVHRGTSIIEIKPQTACNLDCIYCSVGEGLSSNQTDYLVERSYLLEEFKKVAEFVASQSKQVEAHIGVQGEPFIYAEFVDLVDDLSKLDYVYQISTDTNGTLLSKPLIDKLASYPKLRLNISLNSLDPEIAAKMAGTHYNLQHVIEMIKYAAEKMDILVAPLYVPGFNEGEIPKVVNFVKTLPQKHTQKSQISSVPEMQSISKHNRQNHPMIGIQNFLNYRTGRNPVKALGWDSFKEKLIEWEKQTNTRLLLDFKKDFKITETKELPKPFRKEQTIKAKIAAHGRYPKTRLAVAKDRVITVIGSDAEINSEVKLKISRSKHNIFFAKEI